MQILGAREIKTGRQGDSGHREIAGESYRFSVISTQLHEGVGGIKSPQPSNPGPVGPPRARGREIGKTFFGTLEVDHWPTSSSALQRVLTALYDERE